MNFALRQVNRADRREPGYQSASTSTTTRGTSSVSRLSSSKAPLTRSTRACLPLQAGRQFMITPSSEPRLLLRIEEAAERLGIGRSLMYHLVLTGEVEPVRGGRLGGV